jgi:hypothetical protein
MYLSSPGVHLAFGAADGILAARSWPKPGWWRLG